jgi:AraC-like DNA-binding protein
MAVVALTLPERAATCLLAFPQIVLIICRMLADLKLEPKYDGLIYLAESARNPPTLRPHRHMELELNLVLRGSISYVVGGRRVSFARGTLLWLFPAQEHQLVDRSADAQFYVAVFKPAVIAQASRSEAYAELQQAGGDLTEVRHSRLEAGPLTLLRQTMDDLLAGGPDPDLLNREAGYGVATDFRYQHNDPEGLNAGLRHLLLLGWRTYRGGRTGAGAVALHPAVRKALEILSDGHDGLALPQLAKRCGASEAHLSRLFARQIGVPLARYRNSVRLARFFDLYRGPEQKTMAEAVFAAGFGSYAQFHRVFTQAHGRGPRECLR